MPMMSNDQSSFIWCTPNFYEHHIYSTLPNTIEFGNYYKSSSNYKEPIEWIIPGERDNKFLLIGKYAIDCQHYNTSIYGTSSFSGGVTWEECSLREWLNREFLCNAFTREEKKIIMETTVTADPNPAYSTPPGHNTKDKVFLLSAAEVTKFFNSNIERQCEATKYSETRGAFHNSVTGKCWWWLRSPGNSSFCATYVNDGGVVCNGGINVSEHYRTVRPALWINLDS